MVNGHGDHECVIACSHVWRWKTANLDCLMMIVMILSALAFAFALQKLSFVKSYFLFEDVKNPDVICSTFQHLLRR
jgi:hypothetical protein